MPSRSFEPGAPAGAGEIPLCVPSLHGNEWKYVKDCLDTNYVSSVGQYVDRFERELAAKLGIGHAVATSSGTAALHVALLLAGVEPDDEIIVSTLSFIAPANAIRYTGAWPIFADVDSRTWQMDPEWVREFITRRCQSTPDGLRNHETGRRVRAILPVHILGHPVDIDPLVAIARSHDLRVVEDATESLGARYRGRIVGALGDLACFSFNGNKLITTGGGGMIVTGDAELARRAKYLTTQAKDDPIAFIHGAIGYNYRLTNLQAAVGCAQLEQLDHHLAAKRQIANRYAELLGDTPGIGLMPEADWANSAWWLYTITVDPRVAGCDSRAVMRALAADGIQARPLWQCLHQSPAHRVADVPSCPQAEAVHALALSLPSSVDLTAADQRRIADVVCGAVRTPHSFSSVA